MPVIYSIVQYLSHQCFMFDLRTLIKYILLSFCTSILVNLLLPSIASKSSSTPSSSLTLFSSNHIFFPSDVNSLQCAPSISSSHSTSSKSRKKRTYTKETRSTTTNVSRGKFNSFTLSSTHRPQMELISQSEELPQCHH